MIEEDEMVERNSSLKFNNSKKGKDLLDVLKSNKLNQKYFSIN
jgi:hypothetical protein